MLIGILAGTLLIVLLNNVFLLNPGSEGPYGSTGGIIITVLWFLGGTAGAAGIGTLAGKIAGRLEALVAAISVVMSTAMLWFLPHLFWNPNSYTGEPGSLGVDAVLLNIPVLLFALVGGMVAFFARRTDLR